MRGTGVCATCEGTGIVSDCPRPGWCSEHICHDGECPDCMDPALPPEPEEPEVEEPNYEYGYDNRGGR